MKNLVKWFGIIAIIAIIGFSMAGCATLFPPPPEFPTDFTGTWIRVNLAYPHTLTLTSKTIKASNQTYYWNLTSISGDSYNISQSNGPIRGTVHLKLVGDKLEIVDAYDAQNASEWSGGENDWTGTWKRK
jgi:hypothetical protein